MHLLELLGHFEVVLVTWSDSWTLNESWDLLPCQWCWGFHQERDTQANTHQGVAKRRILLTAQSATVVPMSTGGPCQLAVQKL